MKKKTTKKNPTTVRKKRSTPKAIPISNSAFIEAASEPLNKFSHPRSRFE
jgi:hypothetical protein